MKVCVLGIWHLGTVTAACLASGGHGVTGLDFDAAGVTHLSAGRPPLFEPGLEELVKAGLVSGRLRYTTDVAAAVNGADIVWVADDTSVDDDNRGDVEYVVARTTRLFPHLTDSTLVLISAQVPVGTTRRLEQLFAASRSGGRSVHFGYSREKPWLGKAIQSFTRPDRVVVSLRSRNDRGRIEGLLRLFT